MRLATTLLAGLLLGLLPLKAAAGCLTPSCWELKGLSAVGIAVDVEKSAGEKLNLTQKSMKDLILETLRTKLPRLKVGEGLLIPSLSVVVTERFSEDVHLLRDVEPLGSAHLVKVIVMGLIPTEIGAFSHSTLWAHAVVIANPSPDVKTWIGDALTAFAEDWTRVNPGKRDEARHGP
ncbi:MAG: hypothetical protein ACE5JS_09225 [Nitrospinota bacterium]